MMVALEVEVEAVSVAAGIRSARSVHQWWGCGGAATAPMPEIRGEKGRREGDKRGGQLPEMAPWRQAKGHRTDLGEELAADEAR